MWEVIRSMANHVERINGHLPGGKTKMRMSTLSCVIRIGHHFRQIRRGCWPQMIGNLTRMFWFVD